MAQQTHALAAQARWDDETGEGALCNVTYANDRCLEITGAGVLGSPLKARVREGYRIALVEEYTHDNGDELVSALMRFATNTGELYEDACRAAKQAAEPGTYYIRNSSAGLAWANLATRYVYLAVRKDLPHVMLLTASQFLRFALALEAYYADHIKEA